MKGEYDEQMRFNFSLNTPCLVYERQHNGAMRPHSETLHGCRCCIRYNQSDRKNSVLYPITLFDVDERNQ